MKFAYLVMAHHRFDVLKLLLQDLDDERNDIFLHIDKKTGDYDGEEIRDCVKKANLIFVKREPVYWGHYTQIKCVRDLLKVATQYSYHDYYHLLVGVEFPLKTQDEIFAFFQKNKGYEFIGFDEEDICYLDRIKYWHFWGEYARSQNVREIKLYNKANRCVEKQRKYGVNRIRGKEQYYKKGYANWSITHDLACYIVKHTKNLQKYKYTHCADEIFVHTLVYNSKFYDAVYDKHDEYHSVMRLTTWKDPRNQFHLCDVDMLCQSDKLFARKFDDKDAVEIIKKIKEHRGDCNE